MVPRTTVPHMYTVGSGKSSVKVPLRTGTGIRRIAVLVLHISYMYVYLRTCTYDVQVRIRALAHFDGDFEPKFKKRMLDVLQVYHEMHFCFSEKKVEMYRY